jgi:ferredoxin-type protein NapG
MFDLKKHFLRPPGARSEKEFLSRCLQCGQCAQVCIFDCIKMRRGFNFFLAGTPEINPKEAPCHLCMRCSAICPSDALHDVAIEDVRMGFAELDRKKCYTWREYLLCRSCYERCPIKWRAMRLERGEYPVITDECAGCGLCEHVCPADAIVITPTRFQSSRVDEGGA